MAPISLASILPVYSRVNTPEQNGCHALLISDYSSTSKCLLAHKCNVVLERYRKSQSWFKKQLAYSKFATHVKHKKSSSYQDILDVHEDMCICTLQSYGIHLYNYLYQRTSFLFVTNFN